MGWFEFFRIAEGWVKSLEGTWIRYFQIEKNWNDARNFCQSLGQKTDLVTILSKEQGDWMIKYVNCTDCINFAWTGAIDLKNDGEFRWVSNNETVSIADWDVVYHMEENSARRSDPSEASEIASQASQIVSGTSGTWEGSENEANFHNCIMIFGDENATYSDWSLQWKIFFLLWKIKFLTLFCF